MAGSLQGPLFKNIYPTHKCSLTSKYKSIIIKNEKLRLLRTKGKHFNKKKTLSISRGGSTSGSGQEKPQQLYQLLKQVKYCQSLSWNKLLLLLASSLSSFTNDSSWTAATKNVSRNCYKNLTATTRTVINYVQQQQQRQQYQQQQQHFQLQNQQQQLQLQLLQIFNKVFKSSKFCKNLLNRKKLQQLQLRQIQKLFSRNQLYEKTF